MPAGRRRPAMPCTRRWFPHHGGLLPRAWRRRGLLLAKASMRFCSRSVGHLVGDGPGHDDDPVPVGDQHVPRYTATPATPDRHLKVSHVVSGRPRRDPSPGSSTCRRRRAHWCPRGCPPRHLTRRHLLDALPLQGVPAAVRDPASSRLLGPDEPHRERVGDDASVTCSLPLNWVGSPRPRHRARWWPPPHGRCRAPWPPHRARVRPRPRRLPRARARD
jgi:hypothetical protein